MRRISFPVDPPPSAPEWMVTYSDMVSLLVTFFVMLMTFSTLEEDEAMVVLGAFGQNVGGAVSSPGQPTPVEPPRYDRLSAIHAVRGADRPHARPPEDLPRNLAEMGQRRDDEHIEIDFAAAPDGLALSFGAGATFAPGSAEIREPLRLCLAELAAVLSHYDLAVVVEGHAGRELDPPGEHSSAAELSAARARAAAEALLATDALEPALVQVAAFGCERPLGAPAADRRIEIRLLPLAPLGARALRRGEREGSEAR